MGARRVELVRTEVDLWRFVAGFAAGSAYTIAALFVIIRVDVTAGFVLLMIGLLASVVLGYLTRLL